MLILAVVLSVGVAVGVRRAGEAVPTLGTGVAVELAVPADGPVAELHAAANKLSEQRIAEWRIRCPPASSQRQEANMLFDLSGPMLALP